MNNKILLFSSILAIGALTLLTLFNYDTMTFNILSLDDEKGHAKVMTGHIQLILTDENGNVKQIVDKHNLIVGEGLKTAWDLTFPDINLNGNATDAKFNVIGIGDGNTAAASTDTGLQTPITGCSKIKDATITGGGTNALVWAYTSVQFAGTTCASTTISEAVLVNSLTGGEVLARQTFTDINVGALDTLTVNWNVTLADDGV